tara:strand:- start:970 stop:1398 length:429 start_codon:yes stop_codon:yes gene_type:complete
MSKDAYILIPTRALMCEDVPHGRILHGKGEMHPDRLPIFFSLVEEAFERWHKVMGDMAPAIYSQYHTLLGRIRDLQNQIERVLESDDESFFEHRNELGEMLCGFDSLMDHFANAFKSPSNLRNFYFNIASRLRSTVEAVLGE